MTHPSTHLPIWTSRRAQPVGPWHPVWSLLGACVRLTTQGVTVRSVALRPSPRIVIDPPPPGLLASYTYANRLGQRLSQQHCIAHVQGIPVIWTIGARP